MIDNCIHMLRWDLNPFKIYQILNTSKILTKTLFHVYFTLYLASFVSTIPIIGNKNVKNAK